MNIVVRNYHLDGYGHVNHARYLEFLEEARWQFLERLGLPAQLGDIMLVVVRLDIRYRRSAKAGETLNIACRIKSLSARHWVMGQSITLAGSGEQAVEAEISLMPVCAASGKSTRFPESLLTVLRHSIAE